MVAANKEWEWCEAEYEQSDRSNKIKLQMAWNLVSLEDFTPPNFLAIVSHQMFFLVWFKISF